MKTNFDHNEKRLRLAGKFQFVETLVTRPLILETPVTFLSIENNNMNNYIETFEYKMMVTAFAIHIHTTVLLQYMYFNLLLQYI